MSEKTAFVLRGRIITMLSENNILNDGYIGVRGGRIVAVTDDADELPDDLKTAPIIESEGTIYPGLLDLHNHFVYNVLPLWIVPKKFDNRSQWPSNGEYRSGVSKPIKQALAKYSVSSKALIRFVEAKALIGGTTTGQGILTQVKGSDKIFEGAMRNVEAPGHPFLKKSRTKIQDLDNRPDQIDAFRKALEDENLGGFFYHLAEGVDESSQRHFLNLREYDLVRDKLVGIHSLGLNKDDLKLMAKKKAKVVWSPFSNHLLYGQTINLKDLKASNVVFSLGCDWTPSGSKNLLQELKVALFFSEEQENIFSPYELVQLVTSTAAKVVGWESYLGTLEREKIADLLVLQGKEEDPYLQLIMATEKNIELVVVEGIARYGSPPWMKKLKFDAEHSIEEITIGGRKKALYLYSEHSEINDIGLNEAIKTLQRVMKDLPEFVKEQEEQRSLKHFEADSVDSFQIELDNEFQIADPFQAFDSHRKEAFVDPPMAKSVELDTLIVEGKDYWRRIEEQNNIPDALKSWLRKCYQ